MKLALVQRAFGVLSIQVVNSFDELLSTAFRFPNTIATPHVHKVSNEACLDQTGDALVREILSQERAKQYKVMRV